MKKTITEEERTKRFLNELNATEKDINILNGACEKALESLRDEDDDVIGSLYRLADRLYEIIEVDLQHADSIFYAVSSDLPIQATDTGTFYSLCEESTWERIRAYGILLLEMTAPTYMPGDLYYTRDRVKIVEIFHNFARLLTLKLNKQLEKQDFSECSFKMLQDRIEKWEKREAFFLDYGEMLNEKNKDKYVSYFETIPYIDSDYKMDKHSAAEKFYDRLTGNKNF